MLSTKLISDRAPFLMSALLSIIPFLVLQMCIDRKEYETVSFLSSVDYNSSRHPQKKVNQLLTLWISKMLYRYSAVPVWLMCSVRRTPPSSRLSFSLLPCRFISPLPNDNSPQFYMLNEFQMDSDTSHLIQLVTGIYIMLNNGFGIIWLRSRFDEQRLMGIGMAAFVRFKWDTFKGLLQIVGFTLFFFWFRLWFFFFIMPFISLGMSVVGTVGDSMLTSLVDEHEQVRLGFFLILYYIYKVFTISCFIHF